VILDPESDSDPGPSTVIGPARLRLATWNLNHWRQPLLPTDTRRGAWDHLSSVIGAQVALVQEAVPPVELGRDRAVYGELAGHRNWGSAVGGQCQASLALAPESASRCSVLASRRRGFRPLSTRTGLAPVFNDRYSNFGEV